MGFVKSYPWCGTCEISLPWNGDPTERCPHCGRHPRLGPRRSTKGKPKDWGMTKPKPTGKVIRHGGSVVGQKYAKKDSLEDLRKKLKEMFKNDL